VRVIRSARPERNRIECRRPGADANPYLALAALAVSAADGIKRGATPPEPIVGDAAVRDDLPQLPRSLESALRAFAEDDVLRQALGSTFSDYYAISRQWEVNAWQEAVSDWERERYGDAV
jgi:glutamine synthetase